jgi:hypothetical protein
MAESPPAVRAPARPTWRVARAGGVSVDVLVDGPTHGPVDVVLLYHGTVGRDAALRPATERTLEAFRRLIDRKDMLLVSVAYPEEGRLFGDNFREAEAALRWVREAAPAELGVTVGRVFLAGHSQGGSLVIRLNTLHAVDGVIASAPGPLDLGYRCGLEERGEMDRSVPCTMLAARFGPTTVAPEPYAERSLLHIVREQRSDLIVLQGLEDAAVQLRSWPRFREQLEACGACRDVTFLEVAGLGHGAMFQSAEARAAVNAFLERR